MTQLSTVCFASPINNQIIFFNGHYIHFDEHSRIYLEDQNIQLFVLKSRNSDNEHTNYNGSYAKLKFLYNGVKAS